VKSCSVKHPRQSLWDVLVFLASSSSIFAVVFSLLIFIGDWKASFMTLFCFPVISLFFWGCGFFLVLFTLAPYNIYSFREVNIYINNKNKWGRGGGFDSKYLLRRECFFGLEAPWRFRSLHLVLNGCVYLLCIHIWLNSLIKYTILDESSL